MIESPTTGETVVFESETEEVLVMRVTWPRPGQRAPRHLHPGMQERWEVIAGRPCFEVDGVLVEGRPGTVVVAPPGRPHLAWNGGQDPAELRVEMRPPKRWREFVTRLFGGEDPGALLEEFSGEIVLANR